MLKFSCKKMLKFIVLPLYSAVEGEVGEGV